MSDDFTKKRPQDATKINLGQQWEIDYWTRTLNTSEFKLKLAVQKVGNSVSAVKELLRTHVCNNLYN